MRKSPILLFLTLFLSIAPLASSAQQSNAYLTTGGNIRYSSDAHKLFSTSFDEPGLYVMPNNYQLSNYVTFRHRFNYDGGTIPSYPFFYLDHGGEDRNGFIAPTPHGGGHSLGKSRINSERAEFLNGQTWGTQSRILYISWWEYWPSNWVLDFPPEKTDEYEPLMGIRPRYIGDTRPSVAVTLYRNGNTGAYSLRLGNRIDRGGLSAIFYTLVPYDVNAKLLGHWNHFEWWLDRGTEILYESNPAVNMLQWNGKAKLWINDELILNSETQHPSNVGGLVFKSDQVDETQNPIEINIFDMYIGNENAYYGGKETRWMDDLEIWDGLPSA